MLFQQTLTWITTTTSKARKTFLLPFQGKSQTESFLKQGGGWNQPYTSLLILIHASVTGKAYHREYEWLVFVTFGKIPRILKKIKNKFRRSLNVYQSWYQSHTPDHCPYLIDIGQNPYKNIDLLALCSTICSVQFEICVLILLARETLSYQSENNSAEAQ